MMDWGAFHFVRPWWFLALLPLMILWLRLALSRRRDAWRRYCDPHLLPYLMEGEKTHAAHGWLGLLAVAWILAVIALAGPVWQTLPSPVYRGDSARVILLDLSLSMNAADIKPSRLEIAKFKVLDILNRSRDGQTALIVFAGDAHVVTPLTEDTKTISNLLAPLTPELMPAQGSHVHLALQKGLEVLESSGARVGELLLISDGMSAPQAAVNMAKTLRQKGYRVSVLAVGTADAAPISLQEGGFLKDHSGSIVLPKLDYTELALLSKAGGGRITRLTKDDADLVYLLEASVSQKLIPGKQAHELQGDIWREEGPWLVLMLLPLMVWTFRRGWVAVFVLALLPFGNPSYALTWSDLWWTQNQQAAQAMQAKNYKQAASKFNDPQWKASALYRAGEFDKAAQALENVDADDAYYNRGNALAKLGRYEDAIKAYESALAKNPNNKDALENKKIVEDLVRRQRNPDNQPQQSQQQQQKDNGSSQQNAGSSQQEAGAQNSPPATQAHSGQEQAGEKQQAAQKLAGEEDKGSPDARNPARRQAADDKKNDDKKNDDKGESPSQQHAAAAEKTREAVGGADDMRQSELQQSITQWLRQVPDDPAGLMREKFRRQHTRRKLVPFSDGQAW